LDDEEMKENLILNKSHVFAVLIIKIYKFLTYKKKEYILSKQLLTSETSIRINKNDIQAVFIKKI